MDLSLLPNRVSEYGLQNRGAHFTVRSASSSCYQPPNRQTLQRQRRLCTEQADQSDTEKTEGRTDEGFQADSNGTLAKADTPASLDSWVESLPCSNMSEKTGPVSEVSPDCSGNIHSSTGTSGRTDGRRDGLGARSQSADWRGGATRTGLLGPSGYLGASTLKRAESLESKGSADRVRAGGDRYSKPACAECVWSWSGTSVSRVTQVLDRATVSQSFPARLRASASSHASGPMLREKAGSVVIKPSQSISARIEKLYSSSEAVKSEETTRVKRLSAPVENWLPEGIDNVAGSLTLRRRGSTDSAFMSPSSSPSLSPSSPSSSSSFSLSQSQVFSPEGKTWSTFPRRFSRFETSSLSVVQGGARSPGMAPTDTTGSVKQPGPGGTSRVSFWSIDRTPGAPRQSPTHETLTEVGTMSLDRSRVKFTVASQVRLEREVAGVHTPSPTLSHTLADEDAATPLGHPGGIVGRDSGKGQDGVSSSITGESRGNNTSDKVRERLGSPTLRLDLDKRSSADGVKADTKADRGMPNGTGSQLKTTLLNSGSPKADLPPRMFPEKLVVPSAASVRNKIHQFEILSQRAQGTTVPGQYLKPRRAFSVPEMLTGPGEGPLRSGWDKGLAGMRSKWEGLWKIEEGGKGGEDVRGTREEQGKSGADQAVRNAPKAEEGKAPRGWNVRSVSVDEIGLWLNQRNHLGTSGKERTEEQRGSDLGVTDPAYYSKLKGQLEIPLNSGSQKALCRNLDEPDFAGAPEVSQRGVGTVDRTDSGSSPLFNNNNNNDVGPIPTTPRSGLSSPASDEDRTPTNTPHYSPFFARHPLPGESTASVTHPSLTNSDSPVLPGPVMSSSPTCVPQKGLTIPQLKGQNKGEDLDVWMPSLNQKIEGWNNEVFDEDDDEGTEKDDDSNYDSDDSSVTITSNMSQSDRRSFSLSLADLCNIGGVVYESSDSDEWSAGRRSASLSSDVSALSCVSVLASEELDRLLDDVRSLGDNTLQNYEDVQVVVLHKEVGAGLGFTLAGGVDQNKPVTVHKVFPSSVADKEGSIREGDKVLSINGTALRDSAHGEAIRTLRRARNQRMGVVVVKRGVSGPSSVGVATNTQGRTPQSAEPVHTRVCVRLEKGNRDLGFSLEGGVGSSLGDRAISVQKIFLGGPVGEVSPGDEVLEINGVSVVGMRRLEAWTLIRNLPSGPVEVVLHRPLQT